MGHLENQLEQPKPQAGGCQHHPKDLLLEAHRYVQLPKVESSTMDDLDVEPPERPMMRVGLRDSVGRHCRTTAKTASKR